MNYPADCICCYTIFFGHFFENKKWELKLVKFVLPSEMPLTETTFNIVESLMLYAPINGLPAGRRQGMGWGFDCLCWPWGRAFDWSCSPRGGDIWTFFARRGDIWLPTRTKKIETEHMFAASTLHACAVRSRKIGKSCRPTGTSERLVDFTVLSPNFVCFSVFLVNWTSYDTVVSK